MTDALEDWPGSVSVVIPAFNAAHDLPMQMAALRLQRCDRPWELVIVDNASTDGTGVVASSIGADFPVPVRVVTELVQGIAPARNAGANAASGDLVLICDADDVVMPGWLQAMVDAAEPDVVLAGAFDEVTLNSDRVRAWIWDSPPSQESLALHLGFRPFSRGANFGASKALISRLGGWRHMVSGEDVEFSWRAIDGGFELRHVRSAVVQYRFRASLTAVRRQAYKVGRSDVELYRAFRNEGLQAPRPARVIRTWLYPWKFAIRPWDPAARGRFVRTLSYRLGRLRGCIEHRVWFA